MDGSQNLPSRTHSRNKSSITKATRPRSSTKGPLDADDAPTLTSPAAALQPTTSTAISAAAVSSPLIHRAGLSPTRLAQSPRLSSPIRGSPSQGSPVRRSPRPPGTPTGTFAARGGLKDFSYLLRPEIYHPLPSANVPLPFRNSENQPGPGVSLQALLSAGQFRAAAIVAAQELTGTVSPAGDDRRGGQVKPLDPKDHSRIFDLLYTRLACLMLIDATSLAAQEGKALEDLNSAVYFDDTTGTHLVPWELRVLNVRLQALGFGDPRRSVMSFYDLAREARARIAEAIGRHDNSASELWKGRLSELGIKVASALIEMDDMAGAAAHLATLRGASSSGACHIETAKALLWLHLGDVDAARACVHITKKDASDSGDLELRVVSALCDMADDDYEKALATWQSLHEDAPDDEMINVNLAVSLLYVGRMQEGRTILESLVDEGYSSHTLLFNLSTMYELCTDRAKAQKQRLAQRLADKTPSAQGWEKTNADFKL